MRLGSSASSAITALTSAAVAASVQVRHTTWRSTTLLQPGVGAAVHGERHAGDEAGGLGAEERAHRTEVGGVTHVPYGDARGGGVAPAGELPDAVGVVEAGLEGVHSDPVGCDLTGEGL